MRKLLNVDANAKTVKGQKQGYLTGILYLAPADLSGYEVCPQRSAGCTEACLNTAGRGVFSNVQASRISKTKYYFENRPAFIDDLVLNIKALERKANRMGLTPVVRLNGTSDIAWERVPVPKRILGSSVINGFPNIMAKFPHIQFYDYTKVTKRAVAYGEGRMPSNYSLTFSLTEDNDADAIRATGAGCNVAVVFKTDAYAHHVAVGNWDGWMSITQKNGGAEVVDGDQSDLRFADKTGDDGLGLIVALKAKGPARYDVSGFVRS